MFPNEWTCKPNNENNLRDIQRKLIGIDVHLYVFELYSPLSIEIVHSTAYWMA